MDSPLQWFVSPTLPYEGREHTWIRAVESLNRPTGVMMMVI
jgi:hypothetical protein